MSNAFIVTNRFGAIMGVFANEEAAVKSIEYKYGQVDILSVTATDCENANGVKYKSVVVEANRKYAATYEVQVYPLNETVARFYS